MVPDRGALEGQRGFRERQREAGRVPRYPVFYFRCTKPKVKYSKIKLKNTKHKNSADRTYLPLLRRALIENDRSITFYVNLVRSSKNVHIAALTIN
jgi:hypothetical protein